MKIKSIKQVRDKIDDLSMSARDRSLEYFQDILTGIPIEYKDLINQAYLFKRTPKEYLLSSILFSISTSIGLTFYINALGYKNYANLYFAIIGSRGDTKSEAIKIAIEPLKELDDQDYEEHLYEMKTYDKENEDEPIRKQILVKDATIEGAHKVHSENINSIGLSYDEIYYLIEKMGNSNSRDGVAWRTFFLEGYTNGYVDVSRKTTKSFRIKETYPTLLGGLQHQFIPKLFANGNLESGFIDRLLFTPKLKSNNRLSKCQVNQEVINNYKSSIFNILAYKRQSENIEEVNKQFEVKMDKLAEENLYIYVQELIERQNKSQPIFREYISKMQISIHKFCLLIHIMKNAGQSNFRAILKEETVSLAIKINEFYFFNFRIVIEENFIKKGKMPELEDLIKLAKKNNASQKCVAELAGVHKSTVSKRWKKLI